MDDKSEKIALKIQTRLLQHFIRLARSSDEEAMLKTTLQKTVDLAVEITGAEKGSLFLIDRNGVVTDRIMMREMSSPADSARLIGTVLDKGLAGWVVSHREVGLITDTLEDERWLQLSNQPYTARSAIVTPILKGDNLFGLLSLVHSEPHRFSTTTAELLKATAAHVAIVLENAKLYQRLNEAFHALESANDQIETYSNALSAELEKGRHMQRTFLPEKMPDIPGWQIDACFYPAKQVSGDFYDVFPIDEEHLSVIIADVCDKGVSAALFMGIFRSLIHAYMESAFECGSRADPPLKIKEKPGSLADRMQGALSFLNNYIEKHHGKEGIFATLFFGILDTRDGQLEYINAGHDPLMIVKGKSVLRELLPTGPAIGITSAARFTIGTVRIDQGETLIGFTDGITDASTNSGERFCRAGIHASIERLNRPGKALIRTILKDVFRHLKGSDLTDDIAMISISRMTKTR
jgi:sigma-B regulation protein RsbU (phosphoserine phosphatase)